MSDFLNGLVVEDDISTNTDSEDVARSMATAFDKDPVATGKAQQLADKTGLPIGTVERNTAEIEKQQRLESLNVDDVLTQAPEAREWLKEPNNAALVSDDFSWLGRVRKTMRDIPDAFGLGINQTELVDLRNKQMDGSATAEEIARANILSDEIDQAMLGTGGAVSDTLVAATQSAPLMMKSISQGALYSMAAGGFALAAGQAGPQIAAPEEVLTVPAAMTFGAVAGATFENVRQQRGLVFDDMMKMRGVNGERIDPATARGAASVASIPMAILDTVGLEKISMAFPFAKDIKRYLTREGVKEAMKIPVLRDTFMRIGKDVAIASGAEGITEMGQEMVQIMSEEFAKAQSSGDFDGITFDEFASRSGEAAKMGAGVGLVYSSAGGSARAAIETARYRKATPAQVMAHAQGINTFMRESQETIQRNPQRFQKLLQDVSGDERFYVNAEAVQQTIMSLPPEQQQVLFDAIPDLKLELETSIATGADVAIKKSDYANFIAPYAQADALAPHMKLDPRDMSVAEREAYSTFMANNPELAEHLESVARTAPPISNKENEKAIQRMVQKAITDAGRSTAEARALAPLFAKSFSRFAGAFGDDALNEFNQQQLTFQTTDKAGNVTSSGSNVNVLMSDLSGVRGGKGSHLDEATRAAVDDFGKRLDALGLTPEQAVALGPDKLFDLVYPPEQPQEPMTLSQGNGMNIDLGELGQLNLNLTPAGGPIGDTPTVLPEGQPAQPNYALIIAQRYFGRGVKPALQAKVITTEQRDLQKRIAFEYEALPDNDLQNPLVQKAYDALVAEVIEQYRLLPIKVDVWGAKREDGTWSTRKDEPYKNSNEMREDVEKNKHMSFFATTPDTFGPPGVDFSGHPLLAETEFVTENGYPMLVNDVFRVVHDFYAHNLSPTTFGPLGEEAAWKNHMTTIKSPWARWALTTETRGQNSWVNFNPAAEGVPVKDRQFARQKAALLPIEYSFTGDPEVDAPMAELQATLTPEEQLGSLTADQRAAADRLSQMELGATMSPEGNGNRFFSKMKNVLELKLNASGTGKQYLDQIKSFVKGGMFKEEELYWSGLEDVLSQMADTKMDKAGLLELLDANMVEVGEFVYDETMRDDRPTLDDLYFRRETRESFDVDQHSDYVDSEIDSLNDDLQYELNKLAGRNDLNDKYKQDEVPEDYEWAFKTSDETYTDEDGDEQEYMLYDEDAVRREAEQRAENYLDEFGDMVQEVELNGDEFEIRWNDESGNWSIKSGGREVESGTGARDAHDRARDAFYDYLMENDLVRNDDEAGGTKFKDYTTRGDKEDYSEMVITLPNIGDRGVSQHFDDDYNNDVSNVMMHIRFDTRTDAEGKKTLFIEEIQSDWHQQGRDKGYASDVKKVDTSGWTARNTTGKDWHVFDGGGEFVGSVLAVETAEQAISEAAKKAENELNRKTMIADAPFKKTWPELAMKRMVMWAVDNGFERVAWATGAMNSDRYGRQLADNIDRIDVRKLNSEDMVAVRVHSRTRGEITNLIADQTKEGRTGEWAWMTMDELKDVFGKGIADQIIEKRNTVTEATGDAGAIKGLDLAIGDKGMRGFYDNMLPNIANSIIKKFGERVKTTQIDTDRGSRTVIKNPEVLTKEKLEKLVNEYADLVRPTVDKIVEVMRKEEGTGLVSDEGAESYRQRLMDPGNAYEVPIDAKHAGLEYERTAEHDAAARHAFTAGKLLDTYNKEGAEAAARRLESNNIPQDFIEIFGLDVGTEDLRSEVNAFDITDAVKEGVMKGFPLFQRERGSITFQDGLRKVVIAFTDRANFSTGVHEFSHWAVAQHRHFAQLARERIAAGDSNAEMQRIADDWETLKKQVGATSDIFTVAQEEKLARMFEAYMREGVAPSEELRRVFTRFRDWLIKIYQDLVSLGVRPEELNPTVKGVFDRWLASENEIEQVRYKNESLGKIAEALGLPQEVRLQIADYVNSATAHAEEKLYREMKAEQKKRESDAYKKELEAMRKTVAEEFEQRREYNLVKFMRENNLKLLDGPETEGISSDLLTDGENHVAPDAIADLYGYDSGMDMIKALKKLPDFDRAVLSEAKKRLAAKYPDMIADGRIHNAAVDAIQNDRTLLAIDLMIREIGKATGIKYVNLRQFAKVMAQTQVRRMKISETGFMHRWDVARDKEMREALKAARSGDPNQAIFHLQRSMVNHMVFKELGVFNEQKEKAFSLFKDLNQKDKALAGGADIDFVGAARAILSKFGLMRDERFDMARWLQEITERDPEIRQDLIGLTRMVTADPKPFKELTVAEFQDLHDSIANILWVARSMRKIERDGKTIEMQQIIGDLTKQLSDMPQRTRTNLTQTTKQKIWSGIMGMKSTARRVEHWVEAVDGGYGGPTRTNIWQPIADASNEYHSTRPQWMRELNEILQKHKKRLNEREKIAAPEIGYTFQDRLELIGMLLHTGNQSNMEKLIDGYGWPEENFRLMLTRFYNQGIITKDDMTIVQDMWDLAERLKPLSQRAHRKLFGYRFDEIEAAPIKTPFGVFRGGYWPAIVDYSQVEDGDIRRAQDEASGIGNSFMMPTTGRGFTMSRVDGYRRPLSVDLRLATSHIDKVLRFAYLEPAVRDVRRIVNNREYREALQKVDEFAGRNMLTPWLQRVARQETERRTGRQADKFSGVWRFLRGSASAQTMMLNLMNAIQNTTSFTTTGYKVGQRRMMKATVRYLVNPMAANREVRELSQEMRQRQNVDGYDIMDEINEIILRKNSVAKMKTWMRRHGYIFQRLIQNVMDNVSWMAAFDKAVEEGMDNPAAIKYADSIVRTSQASMDAKDISDIEAGTAGEKLFLMFYSWFNNLSNMQGTEAANIMKKSGWKGAPALFYMYLMTAAIPLFLARLMMDGIRGELPDDDDDDGVVVDDWMKYFLGTQLSGAFAQLPYAGPALAALVGKMDDRKQYDDRISISPVYQATDKTLSLAALLIEGDDVAYDQSMMVKDGLTAVGFLTGIPLGQLGKPLGFIADVNEGESDPQNAADWARGLVSGTMPKDR